MQVTVVAGVGRGPTELSAYDAALAAAAVHNYNLVSVSSVVPATATVEVRETAPNLGPAGRRLTVVAAETVAQPTDALDPDVTAEPVTTDTGDMSTDAGDESTRTTHVESGCNNVDTQVVASLGWATGSGPGLFYEATGTDPVAVRKRVRRGLDAGSDLREWDLPTRDTLTAVATPEPDAYVGAVAVAAFGTAEPVDGVGGPDRTESSTRRR